MQDKGTLWQRMAAKHGLVATCLEDTASWAFADFFWGLDFDIVSSTTNIRRHGFHGVVDTEALLAATRSAWRRRAATSLPRNKS